MHWPQIVFQGQFVVIFHMTDAFTYFGISSLPGRWREGGLNVVEGCVVLLGKVWGTGGCFSQVETGRSLSGGWEDDREDDNDDDDNDDG